MQLRKISLHPYLFMEGYKSNADLYRTSGKAVGVYTYMCIYIYIYIYIHMYIYRAQRGLG